MGFKDLLELPEIKESKEKPVVFVPKKGFAALLGVDDVIAPEEKTSLFDSFLNKKNQLQKQVADNLSNIGKGLEALDKKLPEVKEKLASPGKQLKSFVEDPKWRTFTPAEVKYTTEQEQAAEQKYQEKAKKEVDLKGFPAKIKEINAEEARISGGFSRAEWEDLPGWRKSLSEASTIGMKGLMAYGIGSATNSLLWWRQMSSNPNFLADQIKAGELEAKLNKAKEAYGKLGLKKGSSVEEIQKKFRAVAAKTHPDIFPEKADKFKEALNAKNFLFNFWKEMNQKVEAVKPTALLKGEVAPPVKPIEVAPSASESKAVVPTAPQPTLPVATTAKPVAPQLKPTVPQPAPAVAPPIAPAPVAPAGEEALIQEAKKYKSAREFVIAKNIGNTDTLYDQKKELLNAIDKNKDIGFNSDEVYDELKKFGVENVNELRVSVKVAENQIAKEKQLTDIWNKANATPAQETVAPLEQDLEADKGAMSGEMFEVIGNPDNPDAGIFLEEGNKYSVQRTDGSYVYNPATKNQFFDNPTEARVAYNHSLKQAEKPSTSFTPVEGKPVKLSKAIDKLPDVNFMDRTPTGWKQQEIIDAFSQPIGRRLINKFTGETKEFYFTNLSSGQQTGREGALIHGWAIDNPAKQSIEMDPKTLKPKVKRLSTREISKNQIQNVTDIITKGEGLSPRAKEILEEAISQTEEKWGKFKLAKSKRYELAAERLINGYNYKGLGQPPDVEFLAEVGQVDRAKELFENDQYKKLIGLPNNEEKAFLEELITLAERGEIPANAQEVIDAKEVLSRDGKIRARIYAKESQGDDRPIKAIETKLSQETDDQPFLKPASGPEYEAEQAAIKAKQLRQADLEARQKEIDNRKQKEPLKSADSPLLAGTAGMQDNLFSYLPGTQAREVGLSKAQKRAEKEAAGYFKRQSTFDPLDKKTEAELNKKLDDFIESKKQSAERKSYYEEPIAPNIQGLSSKKWQVNMPKEPIGKEQTNKVKILKELSDIWGVPIRGKTTHSMGTHAGHYEGREELIRLKKWGELEVLAHEIAHHMDKTYKDLLWKQTEGVRRSRRRPFSQQMIKELANLDYDPKQRRTSEGFPEFIRLLTTTPETAKQLAPKFYDYFTNEFMKLHPEVGSSIEKTRALMKTWQEQGAENRVLAQIDFKGELSAPRNAKEALRNIWVEFQKKWVDEFYPFKTTVEQVEGITGKKLRPSQDPYVLATAYKSKAGAVARTFVMDKAIDEVGNVVGPGLQEILKPIPRKDMKSFIAFATSLRAKNLFSRGIESGFDIDDVNYLIKKYDSPIWRETAEGITKWSNHFLDWLVRAGGLSKESSELIRMTNPMYVLFKRVFDDETIIKRGGSGKIVTGKPVKAIRGSGRPIINPLESMITQATEFIGKSHKIRIASALANIAEKEGIGGIISEVPAPKDVTIVNVGKLKSFIDSQLRPEDSKFVISGGNLKSEFKDQLDELLKDDNFLTVFSQGHVYKGKDNIIPIWRNGKLKFYELDPQLYKALAGIDPLKIGPLLKILSPAKRLLQLGATGLRAAFSLVRNPFRDVLTRAVTTRTSGELPSVVLGSYQGMWKDITSKPGQLAWRFKSTGGDLSSMMGLDRQEAMNLYDEMMTEKLGRFGKTLKVVKNPFNFLRTVFSISELGPRIDEFEKRFKYYKENRPGWSEEDMFLAATNDAQDVTTNFTRSGEWGKTVNQAVAFFNAAIQGPEKLLRSARENPTRFVLRGLAYITLTGLWLWNKNKDKEWYKNLPPEYKYTNYFIEVGNEVVRLPMPFDLGAVFYSIPLSILDSGYITGEERAMALVNIFKGQLPDIMPSLFSPLYDVARNRNYLGKPIESKSDQFKPSYLRDREWSRQFSRLLSIGFNKAGIELSPIQIDYLIDNYTGGAAKQLPKEIKQTADLPIIGDLLIRNPKYPSRQIDKFYNELQELSEKKAAKIITSKELSSYHKLNSLKSVISIMQKRIKYYEKLNNRSAIEREMEKMAKLLNKHI